MDKAYVNHDVHDVSEEAANTARDIIEELQAKKVQTVFDFLWVQ